MQHILDCGIGYTKLQAAVSDGFLWTPDVCSTSSSEVCGLPDKFCFNMPCFLKLSKPMTNRFGT
jgi:hypothetical protein